MIFIKNSKKTFLIVAILSLQFFLFFISVTAVNISDINAAATLVGGQKCEQRYPECPDGYTNFLKGVNENKIKVTGYNQTSSNLISRIEEILLDPFGSPLSIEFNPETGDTDLIDLDSKTIKDLCIQSDITDFIFFHGRSDTYAAFPITNRIYACPSNTSPTRGINRLKTLGSDFLAYEYPWACCPAGYTFVNILTGNSEFDYQQGACCRGNQSQFGYFNQSSALSPIGCYNKSGTLIPGYDVTVDTNMSVDNDVVGFFYYTIGASVTISNNPGSFLPIYGYGEDTYSELFELGVEDQGSNFGCPSTATCSVTSADVSVRPGTSGSQSRPILDRSGNATGSFVTSASAYDQIGAIECTRCFIDGDAIAVEGENLLICDSTQEDLVAEYPLVEGNVQATLAAWREDPQNRSLLIECFERGGLYIGIGCVDPTPVGIITGLIRIAFGVVGGVALVLLILAGIAYQSGDESRIEEAKKRVLSVLGGLAVLVFSVLILRILGVNVLDVVPQGAF